MVSNSNTQGSSRTARAGTRLVISETGMGHLSAYGAMSVTRAGENSLQELAQPVGRVSHAVKVHEECHKGNQVVGELCAEFDWRRGARDDSVE